MFFTSKAFWTATAERAVKSFGQGVVGAIGADAMIDALRLDYVQLAGAGLGMALLSVVTSLASAVIGERGTPSLGPETLTKKVEAVKEPSSPTGTVAGMGSDIPEGEPVVVEEYEGRHEGDDPMTLIARH